MLTGHLMWLGCDDESWAQQHDDKISHRWHNPCSRSGHILSPAPPSDASGPGRHKSLQSCGHVSVCTEGSKGARNLAARGRNVVVRNQDARLSTNENIIFRSRHCTGTKLRTITYRGNKAKHWNRTKKHQGTIPNFFLRRIFKWHNGSVVIPFSLPS
jgi:hypothetical protein